MPLTIGLSSIKEAVPGYVDTDKISKQEESETRLLRRQKAIVLQEVLKYSGILSSLKKVVENKTGGFERFGAARMETLREISKMMGGELELASKDLAGRERELLQFDTVSTEMAEYFQELAQIVEATSLSNASRTAEVRSEAIKIAKERKRLEQLGKDLDEKASSIAPRHKNLVKQEKSLIEARKLFEETSKEGLRKLRNKTKELNRLETDLLATTKTLEDRKEALDRLEIRLRDKEQTLIRTVERLKAKGVVV